ncbi:MAG: hypothetical protein EXS68_02275 [Candidatus Ryanbacteria bacterium]|nr:hypothetical protein [Candidatus Ryanbacteria bacterium]
MKEIIVGVTVVVLLVAVTNPFEIWMPDMFAMLLVAVLAAAVALFAVFVLSERGGDERDVFHRMLADRNAFLAGAGVLGVGIVIESFRHALDAWLPAALGIMVIAKIVSLLYGRRRY